MDKLKILAALPLSRKVFLLIATVALLWANRSLELGMPPEAQQGLIWLTIAAIAAIAFEDSVAILTGLGRFGGGAPGWVTNLVAALFATPGAPPPETKPPEPGAGDSPAKQSGRSLRGLALWLALMSGVTLTIVAGCWTVHQRDERTIQQIQRTIEAREADFRRWRQELENPTPTARDVTGLEVRNEAELGRLRAHLAYEQAKHAED